MSLPVTLPAKDATSEKPIWDGKQFRIGEQVVRVLEYNSNMAGWNDELTLLHEEHAGDNHFIDNASRQHAIDQVKQYVTNPKPVILEIGCSSGYMLRDLQNEFPNATVIGSDVVYAPLVKLGTELPSIPLLRFDLLNCPLPDACVDAVIILNVLEHIEDDNTALQQIKRILKPGGIAVIEVPAGPHLYDAFDKTLKHFRRYSLANLYKQVKTLGFQVCKKSHLGFFLYPGFQYIKKRNQKLLSESAAIQQQAVEKNIQATSKSTILKVLMQLELKLGQWLRYPSGIRCLITCKKPS